MDFSKLKQLAVSDSGFVFNPLTGDTFTLNASGVFLVDQLKQHGDTALAVEKLLHKFDVDEIEAQKDLESFLGQLSTHGLI